MKNNNKLSAKQKKDNTLGLVTLTNPLEEKLATSDSRAEQELAKMVFQLSCLIADVRGFESYGSKIHSSMQKATMQSKQDLIKSILNTIYC